MKKIVIICAILVFAMISSISYSAYHHEGEQDSDNFLSVHPEKTGTKLDHCALCHSGGQYIDSKGNAVSLGSCQWCHYSYGYDGKGQSIVYTLNQYGKDYFINGRNAGAITKINNFDSDGDGYTNKAEIAANRFPGSAKDDPSKKIAPSKVYTRAELEAMPQHTQFLLMNTSRSGDFYAEYTGVTMEYLLNDAGILPSATGIKAYAPDGWLNDYTLDLADDPELYYINGTYPAASFHYDEQAEGWCDYGAPSCIGRNDNDPIFVQGGLKMILAIRREGEYLDTGGLTDENKLDGEGPFRIVPPQKVPSPPDQSSKAGNQDVIWPYNNDWDHNAGSSIRTVTIIKVEPLPEGTTDIDVLEAGWGYVDGAMLVIYGAIEDPNKQEEPQQPESENSTLPFSYLFGRFPYGSYSGIPYGNPFSSGLFGGYFGTNTAITSGVSPFGGYSGVPYGGLLGGLFGVNFGAAQPSLTFFNPLSAGGYLSSFNTGQTYGGYFGLGGAYSINGITQLGSFFNNNPLAEYIFLR